MSLFKQRLRIGVYFVFFLFTVSAAFGQQYTQATLPLTIGSLHYEYYSTSTTYNCWGPSGNTFYTVYFFNGFSYTDINGNTQSFPGTATYADSYNCQQGTAGYPPGASPSVLQFSGTDSAADIYTISVYPTEGPLSGGISYTAGVSGFINPKYKIMGVVYSPPGSQSFVQYTNTNMMGTSTSLSNTFSSTYSASEMVCDELKVPGAMPGAAPIFDAKKCATSSSSFGQENDTNSSTSVNETTTFVNKWPGSSDGLDHGNDIIYVWLNPVLHFSVPAYNPPKAGPVVWNKYSFDPADDFDNGGDMEVVPIRVSECLDPSTLSTVDNFLYNRLQRTWALPNVDGSSSAITDDDLAAICKADPFSDPNYTYSVPQGSSTTTDGRFTKTVNSPFFYPPATANAGAGTSSYTWQLATTQTQGQAAKNTYGAGWSTEESFSGSFFGNFSLDFKQSENFVWTDGWNTTETSGVTNQNQVSITGPSYCAPGSTSCAPYNGPEEFDVYQDNIYGTFMISPILSNFTMSASPTSVKVSPGSNAAFTISTTTNNGYTGSLTFSLQPGLPSGAAGGFSVNGISAGGSTTLTVTTSASTPPGTYPLAVEATDGRLIYFAYFNLVVSTPDFGVSVSPGSQTITAGGGTSFTVATQSFNGFSGNVILSSSGLPSGVSGVFSPDPVAVGSSATLTITSTTSTTAGAYGFGVTGTSGSLSHNVSPNPVLIVNGAATLSSIAVTPASSSVAKGATVQYTATGTYSDNSTKNLTSSVTWSSSNTGVASITSGGLATGVAAGTATIKATLSSVSGSTGLTVTSTTAPSITSLSPTSGPEGTLVTVTGTNFGTTQGTSTLKFNGLTATVTTWSNTQITVAVPRGATTGNVAVLVGGVASNGKTFTVTGALTITSISPTSGPEGTLVTVNGTNFGSTQGTSTLKFNGLVSAVTTWSNTKITVAVPRGATTGNVAVLVNKVASNGITFTVTGALTITSISPTSGAVGTLVTVTGTNFGATQGTSTLKFNGLVSAVTTWSNTKITVKVPSGATTGNIAVLVNKVASNGINFTVN